MARGVVSVAALPVVLWFNVGKSPALAALIAVPLPFKIPVIDVVSVNVGLPALPSLVPANPFDVATFTEDTVPPPEKYAAT